MDCERFRETSTGRRLARTTANDRAAESSHRGVQSEKKRYVAGSWSSRPGARREVVGIEIKQYLGRADLATLVPRVVGQTDQALAQKFGGQSLSAEVGWNYLRGQAESIPS
jgi:hypothetical protein